MAEEENTRRPLPDFVKWAIFPFKGDLQVRRPQPFAERDFPRTGEPGGGPCSACESSDDRYIWADERWRVTAARPSGVPLQLFLESRQHLDLDELDDDMAAELGQMIVRLDRAMQAIGSIGRVHVNRWGDGGSHLHLWFYARPVGAWQMLGFCMAMWAMIREPTPADVWHANSVLVANELAKRSGRALVS